MFSLEYMDYKSNKLDISEKSNLRIQIYSVKCVTFLLFLNVCQKYNHFSPPIFSYIDNVDFKHRLKLMCIYFLYLI